MAGASGEGGVVEEVSSGNAVEGRKRGLSGSMSLRTRKLGRRLSRSMSIVAMKLPEKAHSITKTSSKLMRTASRDKKNRSFELSIILPDKTQKQVTVWGNNTVAEIVCEPLREVGMVVAGLPTGPLCAPQAVPLAGPLPLPTAFSDTPPAPPAALLFLGGSKAPVEPRASATSLEGEVLVVEYQPPHWDGKDLEIFIAWEKIYAATLYSAVELFGKPLLRAAVITKEEYHLLFYYLESVSEASEALTERMRKYIDSGLLVNDGNTEDDDAHSIISKKSIIVDEEEKSILTELIQEGILSQQDVDGSSVITNSEYNESIDNHRIEDDNRSSISSITASLRKVIVDIPINCDESVADSSIIESSDNVTTVTIRSGGQCCTDHRISADANENVWANVRWDFLNPTDFGYDLVRSVKRSRSESAIVTPVARRRNEELYEALRDGESCGSVTPYESIEDLYDCIKNSKYTSAAAEESSPSTESQSEPQFPDYYEKASTTRQSSASSDKSGTSSAFPFSKCGSSDSTGAFTSCESTSGISTFASKSIPESLKCRELPPPPIEDGEGESAILLKQLFMGELMDAYGEYLSAYPFARALLRRKARRDEHFTALADIRRGAAKHTIIEYLELPIERLAQYERLVGGGCARRRAAKLSDLERVQDLFPHDYLALHDADAPAALASHHAQKSKSLRKRPSLDIGGTVSTNSNSLSPRTFIMEAPVQLCPLGSTSPPLDRNLFLFSDLLLVGKSRGTNCFKLKESVRLAELWLSLPDGDDTGFRIGWPTVTGVANYLATYPTQAARDTWYRKIQNALNAQLTTEPKSTNIQIFYKDVTSSIEICKTVSVGPDMSAKCVVRQALHVLQNGGPEGEHEGDGDGDAEAEGRWGPAADFTLYVQTTRDAPPTPLHGIERPHAIQMSRIRQTLSNEDGFDLEHVNAKNNPCGLVFELRKKNQGLKSGNNTPARGLRLLRRSGRLFGIALTRLCNGTPPPALLQALRRLRSIAPITHGVFRRSANAKALRLLRDKLDALGPWAEGCAELDRAPVLLLAALVKEFFRALPQPLLVAELYSSWLQVLSLSQVEKVAAVRSLLLKLPKSHYTMLTYFVCLLQAIAKKSNINLMCPMNLGVCVGPSLLWPNTPCDKAPKAVPMVVELLIVKADDLFGPQISNLLGNGSPEPSNALLDSGAEESDSLHSVGISLDSMELTTPRKEKLSLSRDSGLTLSEDDSNSNGGNSPAPRNILHSLSAPTCNIQPESKLVSRYHTDNHNVNGLPRMTQRQNNYSNKAEMYSTVNEELYTIPYTGERYVHNSINIGISNGIDERNYVSKTALQRSTVDIYGQSPAKYITGLEPQKPPRSLSKAARTSKVYSMFAETQEMEKNPSNKNFNRAKSSDNLLEPKQESIDNKRDLVSSQENIVYSNIHDLAMFTENIQRQNQYQTHAEIMKNMSNTNYSRVYSGWEHKSTNYNSSTGNTVDIYGQMTKKQGETSQNKSSGNATPAATIFTRNDWSRQAARTKSLEVNEEGQSNSTEKVRNGNYDVNISNFCRKRRFDPAHMCTKTCGTSQSTNSREYEKHTMNPLQNSYSYVDGIHSSNSEENKKIRHRNYTNHKLNQSKSLANIVLHSDSSSCDTLYQPQNSFNSRSTESPASENSFENNYTSQYIEPLYTSVYNRRRDIFHEDKSSNMFTSDIYKATPTAVQPEYHSSEKEQNNNKKPPHMPPPVPPRKMIQRVLKNFQPVHVNKDEKTLRSKSVPRLYNGTDKNDHIALDCSESDTESESYV
ncbi:uncharacterized protein LOC131847241 [Achroia grisella]|uniref:uncharacterized protein LOC131847241 n=1 Tax=Achroia grisella TaxID=688607 RepID=UPI0027D22395|nr:uncharacterized protein LOC131847241 [Achroia grisella]XP_059052740.1 uncharacterized protein LOC131847241 [Achroia grisella]